MSPAFDLPMESDDSESVDSPSLINDDLMALEATYQQSTFEFGPEVELFAGELDRYNSDLKSTPAEKRALVFKLLDSYYGWARTRANDLQKKILRERLRRGRRGESNDMEVDDADEDKFESTSADELRRADEEAKTWDLLRRILPLRYKDPSFQPKAKPTGAPLKSRKQYWDEFVLSESSVKERKTVLEWLQNGASHGPLIDEVVNDLQQNAERADILSHGWLHTRGQVKRWKTLNAYQGVVDPDDPEVTQSHLATTTITQLDPDAITRQSRKLSPGDDFFERAIWLGCFEMLRRGTSMSKIRDWCSIRTELWRAATISPLPLSITEDEDQSDFNPTSLLLWRRMCFATARDGGTSDHDRAVHGLLAGDLSSVEKVCESWDDFLFAQYNALLRAQFETFLIEKSLGGISKLTQKFACFNALEHYGEPSRVSKKLVEDLEKDTRTAKEALSVAKVLQGVIVADDLDQHMFYQGIVLSKHANEQQKSKLIPESREPLPVDAKREKFFNLQDHDNLRIMAHILIIVSTLDRLSMHGGSTLIGPRAVRQQTQELLIVAYLSYLRLSGLDEMVPLYCSKIHGPRRLPTLSRNLTHITDRDSRIHQLTLMKKLGMDLEGFVRDQPKLYFADVNDLELSCEAKGKFHILGKGVSLKYGREIKPDFFGEDADLVENEDELMIRSIEWMLLLPNLLKETCDYSIRIHKYFLKRMRLRAARAFVNRVSVREIIRTKTRLPIGDEAGSGWFDDLEKAQVPEEFFEELGCNRNKLMLTLKNLWELECFVRALDAMETLSSMMGIEREENNRTPEMWDTVRAEILNAKSNMKPVLHGWLLESFREEPDFVEIRQSYLVETVLAYTACLHYAGTALTREYLMEEMELSTLVAAPGSDIAVEFTRSGRMKELLDVFTICSKALAIWANEKKGPKSDPRKLRELGWSRELWAVKP